MRKKIYFICFIAVLSILLTANVSANSAGPITNVVIVENAPEDIEVSLIVYGDEVHRGSKRTIAWETYYYFWRFDNDFKGVNPYLQVSGNGEYFEIELDFDLIAGVETVITLDFANRTVKPGKLLLRSMILIGLRLLFTLIIEGIVFFLFEFRQKRSWIVFTIINLITQGLLNIALNIIALPGNTLFYIIAFVLIPAEILIAVIEAVAFSITVKEHNKSRKIIYALTANAASFILGWYLLAYLPV